MTRENRERATHTDKAEVAGMSDIGKVGLKTVHENVDGPVAGWRRTKV